MEAGQAGADAIYINDVLKPDADESRYTLFAEVRVPLHDVPKAKALLQAVMDLW